ncbi:M12 family metallopeptidase [Phycisphaeraceae bacterium AH-315-B13]|nr:M12 family metallopeptidase [Phycisphaeraceae bacterium AH-315-B13]
MQRISQAVLVSAAAILVAGTADGQIKRDGVWQGSDAQKGNPHNLTQKELHREPVACITIDPPAANRGVFNNQSWSNDTIPYAFSGNTTQANRDAMLAAMGELTRVSQVKFIERTNETDYIFIQNSATSNSSFIGRIGGAQTINIFNWNFEFIMVHELMHAIGVHHEQSAVNRDIFVTVQFANIIPSALHNFNIAPNANTTADYDFSSVMHYGTYDFSIDPGVLPTILTVNPFFQVFIGQTSFISGGDEEGLQTMHGPVIPTQWVDPTFTGIFTFGLFEAPWRGLLSAVAVSEGNGSRIVNRSEGTDFDSASPGTPLVINTHVTIDGATLVIR